MKKGFIQIPILIWILASLVAVSAVGTGVVLYKQNKLPFISNSKASINSAVESANQKEEELQKAKEEIERLKSEEAEKIKSEQEAKELAEEKQKQAELEKESPEPIKPVVKTDPIKPAVQAPIPVVIPIQTPTPIQPVQQNIIDPDTQAQLDAIKAEQARQAKCIEATNILEQVKTICGMTSGGIDGCIKSRQDAIAPISERIVDLTNNPSHIRSGQGVEYYTNMLNDNHEQLNQLYPLKSQYELAKSACGQ